MRDTNTKMAYSKPLRPPVPTFSVWKSKFIWAHTHFLQYISGHLEMPETRRIGGKKSKRISESFEIKLHCLNKQR